MADIVTNEKFSFASAHFFSPTLRPIIALPPVPNIIAIPHIILSIERTILIADNASFPTNLETIYQEIVREIERLGYQIAGNIYEEDAIDYLSESDPDNYVYRVEIQVEKLF